jgi:hypothetical protein
MIVVRAAKPNVRQSPSSDCRSVPGRKVELNMPLAHIATTIPAAPPSAARTMPSVSSCASNRRRLTPSATRTAVSRFRLKARASTRFTTFAHAIKSTMIVTPLNHFAAGVVFDASGPRSANTDAASARGRSSLSDALPGSRSICF